jgi:transposase-like protein
MEQDDFKLEGEIEVDETYIGGRKKGDYGNQKKQAVFGAVERQGMLKAKRIKTSGARILIPAVQESAMPGSKIYSDEWRGYTKLKSLGYTHTTISHKKLEYVRGDAYTNTIEGFWGQLKNSIRGTYHAVSPKYLQSYVDEFVFRYNYRAIAVCPVLLERAAKLS